MTVTAAVWRCVGQFPSEADIGQQISTTPELIALTNGITGGESVVCDFNRASSSSSANNLVYTCANQNGYIGFYTEMPANRPFYTPYYYIGAGGSAIQSEDFGVELDMRLTGHGYGNLANSNYGTTVGGDAVASLQYAQGSFLHGTNPADPGWAGMNRVWAGGHIRAALYNRSYTGNRSRHALLPADRWFHLSVYPDGELVISASRTHVTYSIAVDGETVLSHADLNLKKGNPVSLFIFQGILRSTDTGGLTGYDSLNVPYADLANIRVMRLMASEIQPPSVSVSATGISAVSATLTAEVRRNA